MSSDDGDYDPFPSDSSESGGDDDWFRTPVHHLDETAGDSRRLRDDSRAYRSLMINPSAAAALETDEAIDKRMPGAPRIGYRAINPETMTMLKNEGNVIAGDGHWSSVVGHHGGSGKAGESAYFSMGALRVRGAEHEHGDVGMIEKVTEAKWQESAGVMEGFFAKNATRFITVITRTIDEKMNKRPLEEPQGCPLTPNGYLYPEDLFDSPVRINLAIDEYLRRVVGATKVPSECLLIASMYIDRLWSKAGLLVTKKNAHGIVLSCVMMASKMYEDVPYANSYWSALSGTFPVTQLNEMELFILKGLSFTLEVKVLAFQEYAKIAAL